jgi:hypothetical protein
MARFAGWRDGLVIPAAMTVASPDPDPKWTHAKLPSFQVLTIIFGGNYACSKFSRSTSLGYI